MVIVHFQRSRHEVQQTTHVFADAGLLASACITDLLVLRDIVVMLDLRQSIQTEFPSGTLAATTRGTLLSRQTGPGVLSRCRRRFGCGPCRGVRPGVRQQTGHVKQVALPRIRHMTLATRAKRPPLQLMQQLERLPVLLLQPGEGFRGATEHLVEIAVLLGLFRGLLLLFADPLFLLADPAR